jgi:hypothetical protein
MLLGLVDLIESFIILVLLRYRGAMVALDSLQPLQSVRAQSSLVSKLSFGIKDAVMVFQGNFFSSLTVL